MRRLFILILVVIAAFAASLTAAHSANAYSGYGFVCWDGACSSKPCGALVYIHNVTTGANGSTYTSCSGYWSAGGFVGGYTYQTRGQYDGVNCIRYYTPTYNDAPFPNADSYFGYMPLTDPTTRLC